jgi:hypothetical protein
MVRMLAVFCVLTVLEVAVALALGQAPAERPGWYGFALTAVAALMCVGGVESARWLLRRSPAATAPGPSSDWTRLWLWTGVPGGLFLVLGLLSAWVSSPFLGPKASMLWMGHFVTGAMVWLGVAFWPVRDVLGTRDASGLSQRLMQAGLGLHGLGIALYLWGYPALLRGPWKVDLGLLFSLAGHYYFVFYDVLLAGLLWGLVFRFWQPPVRLPQPSHEFNGSEPEETEGPPAE